MSAKTVKFDGDTRGHVNFGWLDSYHSFSFGHYYDPNRVHFGALRVLNDDTVQGGTGFGTHPHSNMEIISIPLKGALAHKDSTGTAEVINTGEVQVMSAGTGITHSEYNAHETDDVNFLQIWILTAGTGLKPRYAQRKFDAQARKNAWQIVVDGTTDPADGPERDAQVRYNPQADRPLWIYQDASIHLADLEKGKDLSFDLPEDGQYGLYVFVISGEVQINDATLGPKDALGISGGFPVNIRANSEASLLAIRVPLNVG